MSVSFSVYAANDPNGAAIATFTDLVGWGIRVEDNGPGAGLIRINRNDAQAVVANLAQGNYVRFTWTEVDADPIFGFFLDEGDFELVTADERGGEVLEFRGMGPMGYLRRAVMWNHSYITTFTGDPDDISDTGAIVGTDPFTGIWRLYAAGSGSKAGQILGRLVGEARAYARPQHPLPELTIDWDYSTDSDAVTWAATPATAEFSAEIGENVLAVVLRLVPTGLHVEMTPDFLLRAWNSHGRDLTATVHFTKAVNIVDPPGLQRQLLPSRRVTDILVSGEEETFGTATLPDASLGVIEGYMTSFGVDATALGDVGGIELDQRLIRSDSVKFGVVIGDDPDNNLFYPGPEGSTSGGYWVGDFVTLDTNNDSPDGSGFIDFSAGHLRVAAINLSPDPAGNVNVELELNSIWDAPANIGPDNRTGSTIAPGPPSSTGGRVLPHTHPAEDSDHSHTYEEFTAVGGTPEVITLSNPPTGLVQLFRQGVLVPIAEVTDGFTQTPSLDTVAGEIIAAYYLVAP